MANLRVGGRVRAMDLDATGSRAYVLTDKHLHVISLANPRGPREIDLALTGMPGRAILVDDRRAYIAAGSSALVARLGRGHMTGLEREVRVGKVRHLAWVGDRLWAARRGGVSCLAIGGDEDRTVVGVWDEPLIARSDAMTAVGTEHLFCARYDEMLLLNVRNPEKVVVVDHWNTDEQRWPMTDATAAGERIYLAAQSLGVLVLELPSEEAQRQLRAGRSG